MNASNAHQLIRIFRLSLSTSTVRLLLANERTDGATSERTPSDERKPLIECFHYYAPSWPACVLFSRWLDAARRQTVGRGELVGRSAGQLASWPRARSTRKWKKSGSKNAAAAAAGQLAAAEVMRAQRSRASLEMNERRRRDYCFRAVAPVSLLVTMIWVPHDGSIYTAAAAAAANQ